jgi:hypothetical protein
VEKSFLLKIVNYLHSSKKKSQLNAKTNSGLCGRKRMTVWDVPETNEIFWLCSSQNV